MGKTYEKAFINRIAIAGHSIIDSVLVLAYVVELLKGARTPGYLAVFSLLSLGPVAAELILYRRNPDTDAIKHLVSISYGFFYLFCIFTSSNAYTWTYACPMFMVIILYMDVRCCGLIFAGALIGNLIDIAEYALSTGYAAEEIAGVEIRVACILLTGGFMTMSAWAVKKENEEKMKQIREQTAAAEAQTTKILETSGGMIAEIAEVTDKMNIMGDSMERMHSSMNEVSTGVTETTESVQKQLVRTEQIQSHIGQVKENAVQIGQSVKEAAEKVAEGKSRMEVLTEQVDRSTQANGRVMSQMQVLCEYTNQMNTIIETITSIANSTGMLALNASIEAARAGEAGRGFAVVAGQISELANQTKTATVNITGLIGHINEEVQLVERSVDEVTESNQENTETARVVAENFVMMSKGTDSVERQAAELLQIVEELETANRDIVENIQTISAITEEVSAHASETYSACEGNASMVSEVSCIVSNLNAEAQKLRQTEN